MIPHHTLPHIFVELLSEIADHDFSLLLDIDVTLGFLIISLLRATKSGSCVHAGSRWLFPLTGQNSVLGHVILVEYVELERFLLTCSERMLVRFNEAGSISKLLATLAQVLSILV